jgi:hypothetical protein
MEEYDIAWNYYGLLRNYKMGTHEVRKSGFLRVYNHYKMGTHDVKKILGLRCLK